jgi:hypothetical protein
MKEAKRKSRHSRILRIEDEKLEKYTGDMVFTNSKRVLYGHVLQSSYHSRYTFIITTDVHGVVAHTK